MVLLGALGFGVLIGWFVYYINRYRKGDVQFSDLTTLVGIIGGGLVTHLFDDKTAVFGAYGIGLALGFFAYFFVLTFLVSRSDNFTSDWFLDGRRKDPEPGFSIPSEARPNTAAMAPRPNSPAPAPENSGANAAFESRDLLAIGATPALPESGASAEALIRDFENRGLSVIAPPVSAFDLANKGATFTIKDMASVVTGQFGLVYGKIRVTLGSLGSGQQDAKLAMQEWIAQIAGTKNSTYSVTLSIQKNGVDVLKAILATNTSIQTKLLGITVSDQYTSTSTTGGISIRGVLVRANSNNLSAKLEITKSDKITFNADAAGKAADAYKALSVVHLVPIAASFTPTITALAGLVNLFFPASTSSSEQLTVPLQFIPDDQIEAKHVFFKGKPIVTVSLELDDTLFQSWNRVENKFSNADPDIMWNEAIFTPTQKHAKDLLRDDLPSGNQNSSAVKKFISDLEGNTLIPFAKLDPPQQAAIGQMCEAVLTTLLDYFTVPDSVAILWIILNRYSTTLRTNGEYMQRCLSDKIKSKFALYDLPLTGLQ